MNVANRKINQLRFQITCHNYIYFITHAQPNPVNFAQNHDNDPANATLSITKPRRKFREPPGSHYQSSADVRAILMIINILDANDSSDEIKVVAPGFDV